MDLRGRNYDHYKYSINMNLLAVLWRKRITATTNNQRDTQPRTMDDKKTHNIFSWGFKRLFTLAEIIVNNIGGEGVIE